MSLDMMRARMNAIGGATNDERICDGKVKSLRSAMRNSMQAEWIHYNGVKYRCLINHVKIATDYDQKEISIEFNAGVKPGEVFYWDRTETHWMILNRRFTEESYYRGEIRQCDYEISTDKNTYHIWTRGPIESLTKWDKKIDVDYNELNYTLFMYITKNEDTNEFFTRHRKVKFDGHNWKVAAVDRYSQENILEVTLKEVVDNEMEDAQVPQKLDPIKKIGPRIVGEQIVYPYSTGLVYKVKELTGGTWATPAAFKKVKIKESNDTSCTLDIITGYSGEFILEYRIGDAVAAEFKVRIDTL